MSAGLKGFRPDVIVAVMSSAIGGYLAARLRTKLVGVHTRYIPVPVLNVDAETPLSLQGDTADRPRPAPKAIRKSANGRRADGARGNRTP